MMGVALIKELPEKLDYTEFLKTIFSYLDPS
jgi:hypothetical protein